MIWRLTYCNKEGVQARLDIIRGASTPVEVIEGTATPFILNYKLDKTDKSGFFMTSSADISIFETASFNIDNLKTSSETEIKVEHYINNVLDWSGFVIPDFFSKTIGTPATVEMVASDRLGTLKGVTLEDLNQYESMRDLAVKCLAKTGLTLPLYTMADFGNNGTTNAFFKALGLSGRLSDTKGRNISCYDILKSILVASNSKLVQQSGRWYIINKFQHEQGAGNLFSTLTASTAYSEQTVSFSDVHVGARRTIIPVGATAGVFHEFGGGRSYPENFDFRDGTTGWTANGGFNSLIKTTPITSYLISTNDAQFNSTISVNPYLFNSNTFSTDKYLQSKSIIPYDTGKIEVSIEINATGPMMGREELASEIRVSIGIEISTGVYKWLNDSGAFASNTATVLNGKFPTRSPGFANYRASTGTFGFKGTYDNPMGKNLVIRIYGSYEGASKREIGYNFVSATFKQSIEEPKGTIYKRTQGVGFTKGHDLDTTIFGDYLTIGLDGAFYQSRVDDTSYLYSTAGTLTEPLWTAHGDAEELPLLRHVTRQKSRMFSLAHNMISAKVDVSTFKPLSIFVDCNSVNPRHVVVSATYDFLRSEVEVELEQIAYATLDVREFIYSYFGEGEGGISSVGGISGGGGGGGGGSTAPSYWQLDENGNLYTVYNAYSQKELSAYGFGGSGGGGGGLIETVYGYGNLGGTFSNADLNNTFNAYTINQLHLRIETLESGGGSGSVTSVGLSAPTGFTVSGSPITSSGTLNLAFAAGYSLPTTAKQTAWDSHLSATNNPHGVTAAQINGLSVSPTEGALGLRSLSLGGFGLKWTPQPTTLKAIKTGIGFGWYNTEWVIGNIRGDSTDSYGFGIGYVQGDGTLGGEFRVAVGGLAYLNDVQVATINSNVASATKLSSSRTIWGQNDADGTGNISGNMTGVEGITATGNNIITSTGDLRFGVVNQYGAVDLLASVNMGVYDRTNAVWLIGTNRTNTFLMDGNVGIGTAAPTYKLDVRGTGRFTGNLTAPKVIFSAAGWSMVQVGTELQMQYNGVAKMRFLNRGSIVAVQEITAYS